MARLDRLEAATVNGAIRLRALRETRWPVDDPTVLRAEAATHGYLFFRRLVPAADVLALRARVLNACRGVGWLDDAAPAGSGVVRSGARVGAYDDVWTRVQCDVQPLAEFAGLREHPTILEVLQTLFGGPVRSALGDTCRVFAPGCPDLTTPPHQDRFYVSSVIALWTVWIPLGDTPRELGGLAVLPGSHRAGLLPHAGEGSGRAGVELGLDAGWASADYRCGDVLMFHGLTVHRALENRTANRLRLSADFRYEAPATASVPDA